MFEKKKKQKTKLSNERKRREVKFGRASSEIITHKKTIRNSQTKEYEHIQNICSNNWQPVHSPKNKKTNKKKRTTVKDTHLKVVTRKVKVSIIQKRKT